MPQKPKATAPPKPYDAADKHNSPGLGQENSQGLGPNRILQTSGKQNSPGSKSIQGPDSLHSTVQWLKSSFHTVINMTWFLSACHNIKKCRIYLRLEVIIDTHSSSSQVSYGAFLRSILEQTASWQDCIVIENQRWILRINIHPFFSFRFLDFTKSSETIPWVLWVPDFAHTYLSGSFYWTIMPGKEP